MGWFFVCMFHCAEGSWISMYRYSVPGTFLILLCDLKGDYFCWTVHLRGLVSIFVCS